MIDTESDRRESCPTEPNLTAPGMPKLSTSFPCRALSVSNTFLRPETLLTYVNPIYVNLPYVSLKYVNQTYVNLTIC